MVKDISVMVKDISVIVKDISLTIENISLTMNQISMTMKDISQMVKEFWLTAWISKWWNIPIKSERHLLTDGKRYLIYEEIYLSDGER